MEQLPSLFRRQPVASSYANPAHAFHSTNAGGRIGTEQPGVGGFIRHAPDRGETQIDRRGCVAALFEVQAIAQNNGAIESETGLGTVPRDKLANGVVVGPLSADGSQAIENRRLGVLEVRQGEGAFRLFPLAGC